MTPEQTSRGACVTNDTPGAASGVSAAHAPSFVFIPYVPSRSVYASGATASSGARSVNASLNKCTAAAKSLDASDTLSPSAALKCVMINV